jgi:hypothetical protein
LKITFNLTDETTVTNDTVKLTLYLTGVAGGIARADIDKTCRAAVEKLGLTLYEGATWAFSGFHYDNNGLTFGITATTRISADQNDQIEQKAESLSTPTVRIDVQNIDPSIPAWKLREAETKLRQRLIELANKEAESLGGTLSTINFGAANTYAAQRGGNATYATSNSMMKMVADECWRRSAHRPF